MSLVPKNQPRYRGSAQRVCCLGALCVLAMVLGCGTTTKRVGTEQLLISDAVDKAVDGIDFAPLKGVGVYLDSRYISGIKTNLFIDSNYVISALRQQLTAAGAMIQEDRENATLVVEPRVGALGADGHDVTYGVPQSGALNSAVSVVSGSSLPVIPEISLGRTDAQSGVAKLVVFAYDRETREPVWQSGLAKAESTSSSTWVLGAGPFQRGTIHEGVRFAGRRIETPLPPHPFHVGNANEAYIPEDLHYDQAFLFKDAMSAGKLPPERVADSEGDVSSEAAQGSGVIR